MTTTLIIFCTSYAVSSYCTTQESIKSRMFRSDVVHKLWIRIQTGSANVFVPQFM